MDEGLGRKERKKLFVYMIAIFFVVSLLVFFFIFNNKVFVMEYIADDVSFKYYSDYKVSRSDEKIIVISKDGLANIEISFDWKDSDYSSSDYSRISNDVINSMVDFSKYVILSDRCVDHMCTRIYESDEDTVEIVVEFRGNVLVTYKFSILSDSFDKYRDGFDIIVNSFVNEL